ncbi:MAG: hypothetical protein COV75_07385 [Candidatus Omnitrophica bacterium CG11_big_fil_rev_8_21_14_0_20_63_9]|nr:MAG: hypothetical protein COV75_07385 [Candidatus Omnitrophica bacterium CG11_big_fil_rev_8_21_14_0_20_63_9]
MEGIMDEPVTSRICFMCEAVAAPGANYCGQCGAPLNRTHAIPASQNPKWYHNVWVVLFMLFFVLGPFALPLVWKNPRLSRGIQIALTLVAVVYTVLLIQLTMRMLQAVGDSMNAFNSTLNF